MEQEEMMSDDERMAMLSQVFAPKEKPHTTNIDEKAEVLAPPSSAAGKGMPKADQETSPSLASFGSLLEQTLVKRNVMEKKEQTLTEEDRKYAISESRQDLIKDMIGVFFK